MRSLVSGIVMLAAAALMLLLISLHAQSADVGGPTLTVIKVPEPLALRDAGRVSATVQGELPIFLVRLQEPPLAAYRGGIAGLQATNPRVLGQRKLNPKSAASRSYRDYLLNRQATFQAQVEQTLGRPIEVVYRYYAANNGFAARLTPQEAEMVSRMPEAAFVQPDVVRQPTTDAGPAWIGAPGIWDGTATGGLPGSMGEGVIVGVIDTGIDPDNPSFAGVGPVDAYTHSNPWGSGNYVGVCDPDNPFYDPTFPCNDKLIGAWGYPSVNGSDPRDLDGHGSHTASTAAGNWVNATAVAPTTVYTATISGVAPHANIVAYAACCTLSALSAAIDQAVVDGVDVINYSIGSSTPPDVWNEFDTLGFLNANAAGIFVATSAGDGGPEASTIGSPAAAPWLTSVGATTHDRAIVNRLTNMTGGANSPPANMPGNGFTSGYGPAPIVDAANFGDSLCLNPFPLNTWINGEIVVCERGVIPRVEKGQNVLHGGAGGLVLIDDGSGLAADPHVLPAVHITEADGNVLKAWLGSGTGHTASISGYTVDFNTANADIMAGFSSRGPNKAVGDLLKPDVSAPGVNILAAYNGDPKFGFLSGTSMSSPHTAGAAALIKDLHPDWTPDEIKSALMTTAYDFGVLKEDGATPADPFDFGAGRIDLSSAATAGLTLQETDANYSAANPAIGGDPSALNLPSLGNGSCYKTCTWTRTFIGQTSATWNTSVSGDLADHMSVTPTNFTTSITSTHTITITADATNLPPHVWSFGNVILDTGGAAPEAHIPVAVVPVTSTDPEVVNMTVDLPEATPKEVLHYTIVVTGTHTGPLQFDDPLPANTTYLTDTAKALVDGEPDLTFVYDSDKNAMTWAGTSQLPTLQLQEGSLFGSYVSLADQVAPFDPPSTCDNGGWLINTLAYRYDGNTYTQVVWSVNGTVSTPAPFSAGATNVALPDPADPNGMFAAFWTDLDLCASGTWYAAIVTTPGGEVYTAFEWKDVPHKTNGQTYSFQTWIQNLPLAGYTSNIWFAYDDVTALPDKLTIGVEDATGTTGDTWYFNGSGNLPVVGTDLRLPWYWNGIFQFDAQVGSLGGWITNEVTVTGQEAAGNAPAVLFTAKAFAVTQVIGSIFTDGFESGDTSAWSTTVP